MGITFYCLCDDLRCSVACKKAPTSPQTSAAETGGGALDLRGDTCCPPAAAAAAAAAVGVSITAAAAAAAGTAAAAAVHAVP